MTEIRKVEPSPGDKIADVLKRVDDSLKARPLEPHEGYSTGIPYAPGPRQAVAAPGPHGSFSQNAEFSQALKALMGDHGFHRLPALQREALDQIGLKLSRILTGNPRYRKHWQDIMIYAKLAQEACDE